MKLVMSKLELAIQLIKLVLGVVALGLLVYIALSI